MKARGKFGPPSRRDAGSPHSETRVGRSPDSRFRLGSLDALLRGLAETPEVPSRPLDDLERQSLERAIAASVIPELKNRLSAARPSEQPAPQGVAAPFDTERMLMHLLDRDARAYHHLTAEFDRLECSAAAFLEGPVRELATRLGTMWSEEQVGFFEVTLAVARLQTFVSEMVQRRDHEADRKANADSILLARMPGDEHTLGLLVVSACFQEDGWEVFGGVDLELGQAALAALAERRFTALGVSVSSRCDVDYLKEYIRRGKEVSVNPKLAICVGGPDTVLHRPLYSALGADVVADDAISALRAARKLTGRPVRT